MHSFFLDYAESGRGPLDVHQWIEHCIIDLRPDPEPETVGGTAPTGTPANVAARLQALAEGLRQKRAESHAGHREAAVAKAIDEWRSFGCGPGEGHMAFFKLASALKRAGLDDFDIKERLREEATYANSTHDRRKEIKGIMRSLRRAGSF